MNRISIAIPAYEYNGYGLDVLDFSFRKMEAQIFKDFNVVISDHSVDDNIKNLCKQWQNKLDIRYYHNENDRGSGAANTTSAMKLSDGEIIKILCADDFLISDRALQIINDNFDDKTNFLATGYVHTRDRINFFNYHLPQMNPNIRIINTVGTPSCVAVRNFEDIPSFDKNLKYCYDCVWYKEYIDKYGGVKLIGDLTIGNYLWEESITSGIDNNLIERENQYILKKYENSNT